MTEAGLDSKMKRKKNGNPDFDAEYRAIQKELRRLGLKK